MPDPNRFLDHARSLTRAAHRRYPFAEGLRAESTTVIPQTLDDLRGRTPEELYRIVEVMDAHLRSLHQTDAGEIRDLDETEQRAFDLGVEIRQAAMAKLDEHRRVSEIFARRPQSVQTVYTAVKAGLDGLESGVTRMPPGAARESALRVLESRDAWRLKPDQKQQIDGVLRDGSKASDDLARRILATETEDYRSAWVKLVTNPNGVALLTEDERRAMQVYEEYRAMSEGTTTAGGFGIPVFIDPSIILTAQGSGNPFLELAQQVTVNTNAWKGVSSAGVTWAFQAEAAAATDNSPVLAQPTVTVFMARGFIPYSIELGQDYPDFANQMATLLAAGYDELLVDKFTRGSGTGEPKGILTALSANTNTRVALTTGGTLGAPDPYKVWAALPQRFRRNANWMMSVATNNAIRQLGTANVYHAYTVNLPEGWTDALFRRGVYESPYMPDVTTNTTATIGLAVVGDFSNFLIARRGGMSVELVPQVFDVTANMPTGQRGWFAYARIGGSSINDVGFRLLTNA